MLVAWSRRKDLQRRVRSAVESFPAPRAGVTRLECRGLSIANVVAETFQGHELDLVDRGMLFFHAPRSHTTVSPAVPWSYSWLPKSLLGIRSEFDDEGS